MKKIVIALGISLGITAGVSAANSGLDQLNEQVVNILAPIQNESTTAQLTFDKLETNTEHALNLTLNAFYQKVGLENKFEFKLDNLSYSYGDGSSPTTLIKGSLGVDFTKLLPQDKINYLVPMAAMLVENFAREYSREFREAGTFKGVVTSTSTDTEGNYTGLTAIISAKIDITKLPENIKSEDVIATESVIYITLNLETGMSIDGYIVSNPGFIAFQDGQTGLKEHLDGLLAGNEYSFANIYYFFERLDVIAGQVVGKASSLKYHKNKPVYNEKISSLILEQILPQLGINIKL